MKIGFVLDDGLDSTDGVQQYILTLGAWLTDQGHQVHYLVGQTQRTDLPNLHSLSRNLSVKFNGNRMTIPLPANHGVIKKLLNSEKYDVLHVQMPYSPFMAARVVRAAPATTKVVGTFHILPLGKLQSVGAQLLSWYLRRTTARFDHIWSVSEPAQAFAAKLGIASVVLPNVVNSGFYNRGKGLTKYEQSFTLVFLGRLVERKGCAQLLQAVQILVEQLGVPSLQVLICGTGPQAEQLQAWTKERALGDVVTFCGYLDEADKPDYLASADIAIFPSLGGESFGIVLIEAMAAGAGVVLGGNNPGYASVLGTIRESLCDPTNPQALADQLYALYSDADTMGRIHHQQHLLVKEYDVAVVGKKLLSYYKDKG